MFISNAFCVVHTGVSKKLKNLQVEDATILTAANMEQMKTVFLWVLKYYS